MFGDNIVNIIHLSDLHIGKSNNLEKAQRVVDWIIENQDLHQAKIAVISGDLVDDGEAWQLFTQRQDKDWSLVDCSSFVIMKNRHISEALTTDHNFEQAGFIPLLKG